MRVMPGDQFTFATDAYYEPDESPRDYEHSTAEEIVSSLLATLKGGTAGGIPVGETEGASLIDNVFSRPETITGIGDIINSSMINSTTPRAGLNYLFFDEQMNLISGSGRLVVGIDPGAFENLSSERVTTTEPGILIVYVDNQTMGKDVWFDNVQVLHYNTQVLEENHYYPFGLTVSASALGITPQPMKYQGIELEKSFGVETYETFFRGLDPQLGRFNNIDPKAELDYGLSPFVSMRNNPVSMIDPFGDVASTHTDEGGNVIAVYDDADLGVYKHEKNADGSSVTKAQLDKRHEVSSSAGGTKMGETHFWDEFRNFNNGNAEGRIIYSNDPRERWDELIKWGKAEAQRIGLMNTRTESGLNGDLDIKNNKTWAPYGVMTGRLYNGKFITARSAGNYLAGFNGVTVPLPLFMSVGLGQQYLTRSQYMGLAGAYQQLNTLPKDVAALILLLGVRLPGPYAGEQEYSGRMIQMGIVDGQKTIK